MCNQYCQTPGSLEDDGLVNMVDLTKRIEFVKVIYSFARRVEIDD